MTSISLKDLKALRAAMTQGRLFTVNPPFGDGTLIRVGAEDAGGEDVADCAMVHYYDGEEQVDSAVFQANATGIVATHNAADVLIEIAEAALADRDAPFEEADAAMQRLLAALAKIKP